MKWLHAYIEWIDLLISCIILCDSIIRTFKITSKHTRPLYMMLFSQQRPIYRTGFYNEIVW